MLIFSNVCPDRQGRLIIRGKLIGSAPCLGQNFLNLLQGVALWRTPGQVNCLFAMTTWAFYEIANVIIKRTLPIFSGGQWVYSLSFSMDKTGLQFCLKTSNNKNLAIFITHCIYIKNEIRA
jgi:hypothetical protein